MITAALIGAAGSALGSLASSALSYFGSRSLNKKSVQQNLAASKDYDAWSALNLPTLQKQGLINAGYNPILAACPQGGGGTISGNGSFAASDLGNVFSASQQSQLMKQSIDNSRHEGNILENDAELGSIRNKIELTKLGVAQTEAIASKASSALRAQEDNIRLKVLQDNPELLSNAIKSDLEGGAYSSSREHKIFEDVVDTVSEAASAFGNFRGIPLPSGKGVYNKVKGWFNKKQPIKIKGKDY